MAYQFGVLTCVVVAAAISISSIIISLWRGDLEIVAGVLVVFGIVFWYWDAPDGFMRRVQLLFRDGVPLAPYGFRRNATLGYWLGIPLIYIGHVITAGTFYLFWELSKQPVEGVPLGIGFGYAFVAYALGIGLVESSYRLWARRLDGATPGDPGSSPLKSVLQSISLVSLLIVLLYGMNDPVRPNGNSSLRAQRSQNPPDTQPALIVGVNLGDFITATFAGWTGEVIHRVDNSSRLIPLPATLQGSLVGGDTIRLKIDFLDSSREPEELRFQLNAEGNRLNDLAVVERTELENGMLRIVVYGDGQDNAEPAIVRATFIFGEARFQLKQYVEQEAGRFLLRDEYNFVRPAGLN